MRRERESLWRTWQRCSDEIVQEKERRKSTEPNEGCPNGAHPPADDSIDDHAQANQEEWESDAQDADQAEADESPCNPPVIELPHAHVVPSLSCFGPPPLGGGLSLCFIHSVLEKGHVVPVCLPMLLVVCITGTMLTYRGKR